MNFIYYLIPNILQYFFETFNLIYNSIEDDDTFDNKKYKISVFNLAKSIYVLII